MRPLNPYEKDVELKDLSFAGELIADEKQAFDFAIGNLNISGRKLEKITNFDPENAPVIENPCYGKRATHTSIWKNEKTREHQVMKTLDENQKIQSCFSVAHTSKEKISSRINEQNVHQNIPEDKSVVRLKPKDEQVWYISKYFKQNSLKNKNNTNNVMNIGGDDNLVPDSDKNEDDKSEDIVQLYNDQPKSVVKSPPCSALDTATQSYAESYVKLNDENQENMCNGDFHAETNSEKKSSKFKFSPKRSTTLGKNIKSNEKEASNWFDQLENDSALESGKVIYNTQSIELKFINDDANKSNIRNNSTDEETSEISKKNVSPNINHFQFTNSPATRQAFKPVLLNKTTISTSNPTAPEKVNGDSIDSEFEKTRKRNPFAKVLITSPKKGSCLTNPEKIDDKR